MKAFKSILQFQKEFSTDEKCRLYLEQQRWNGEPCCPFCASVKVKRISKSKRFQCNEKECRKQFSVTVGTIYENTKISLTKWFLAMYILSNHSKGISSLQLASWLDVTQKTAWFLNHRIRVMLTDNEPSLLNGIVEVDETYIGGKLKNKHVKKRKETETLDNKTMVFGAVDRRAGKVIARIVNNTKAETLVGTIRETIEKGSVMVSDENKAYNQLSKEYLHATVNHSKNEYVRDLAHTNSIEGFWSLLKRQIIGIHHFVSPKHLQRYCDEAVFRYNAKKTTQDIRFINALTNCEGRLTYIDLIK